MRSRRSGLLAGDGSRADVAVVAAGGLLVGVAVLVGMVLRARAVPVHAGAAPLFAVLRLHWGPGSVAAPVVAALVVAGGPKLAAGSGRLPWVRLLVVAAVATLAWTAALASVRGSAGLLHPLSTPREYLSVLPRLASVPVHRFLTGFVASIPADAARPWPTHVAGHPPAMTLVFLLLARAGLAGPGPGQPPSAC